jgi:hypothetical protein
MPTLSETPDGEHACGFSREAGSSLTAPALGGFRKVRAIIEAVGILFILTIKLVCYLGVRKVFRMREAI